MVRPCKLSADGLRRGDVFGRLVSFFIANRPEAPYVFHSNNFPFARLETAGLFLVSGFGLRPQCRRPLLVHAHETRAIAG
jgi:hypothetical protein